MGTPVEFDKILDAGFGKLVQMDFWYRKHTEGKDDIGILTMGLHWDAKHSGKSFSDLKSAEKLMEEDPKDLIKSLLETLFAPMDRSNVLEKEYSTDHTGGQKARMNPIGKCVMLDPDDMCLLHDMNLKPEQGRESCCSNDDAKDNRYYATLWDTDEGRAVVEKWKKIVNYHE